MTGRAKTDNFFYHEYVLRTYGNKTKPFNRSVTQDFVKKVVKIKSSFQENFSELLFVQSWAKMMGQTLDGNSPLRHPLLSVWSSYS